MKEIMTYIIGVVVCSGVFTMFYRAAMHRHVPFRTARIYLLASLLASAVIPALDIPVWRAAPVGIAGTTIEISNFLPVTVVEPPADWAKIALWALWGAGIAVLGVVMARQIVRILRTKRRAEIVHGMAGCEIALSGEVTAPFSFLRTVFVERGTSDEEMRQILLHEASHIRHRHSQEKIAMEVLKNVLWFNPFGWWAARLLAEVHEFEADRDVLDGGSTVEEYLPLIFRQIFGYNPELSVGLGDSLTKKRFMMMKSKMKLTRHSPLRVVGVLPLVVGMTALFGFTHRAPEMIETSVTGSVVAQESAPRTIVSPTTQNPDAPVYSAEEMPVFQSGAGIDEFRNWVLSHLIYPKEAIEKNIGGKVIVRFVIERDGSVSNIEVLESPDRLLTDEVVRVIRTSPKWRTPGMQDGNPVRTYCVMPVEFTLQSDSPDVASSNSDANVIKGEPLVLLDGEEISKEQFEAIDPYTIKEISVLKDASATAIYGFRAKDGVILITTKNGGDTAGRIVSTDPAGDGETDGGVAEALSGLAGRPVSIQVEKVGAALKSEPLVIVDGREVPHEQLQQIAPDTIESISVLKDAAATSVYGEKGENGVIIVTIKNGDKIGSTRGHIVDK